MEVSTCFSWPSQMNVPCVSGSTCKQWQYAGVEPEQAAVQLDSRAHKGSAGSGEADGKHRVAAAEEADPYLVEEVGSCKAPGDPRNVSTWHFATTTYDSVLTYRVMMRRRWRISTVLLSRPLTRGRVGRRRSWVMRSWSRGILALTRWLGSRWRRRVWATFISCGRSLLRRVLLSVVASLAWTFRRWIWGS